LVAATRCLPALPGRFRRPRRGVLNLDSFRRRVRAPAIEASGVERLARIYDLRSTFGSDSLAAGVTVFELARVMGSQYGTLLGGAGASIAARLASHHAGQDQGADRQAEYEL
jgi:hypothetical protein